MLFEVERSGSTGIPAAVFPIAERFRNLAGGSPVVELTPVPADWLGPVRVESLKRAGLSARLRDRTLEVSGEMPVGEAISKVAQIASTLDPAAAARPELVERFRSASRRSGDLLRPVEELPDIAVDSRWLCFIPPSIATLQSDEIDGELEDPRFVFDYYRGERIGDLIAEIDRGGTRAVALICRDSESAMKRFGASETGCIYSGKARPLLPDSATFIDALRSALTRAGFWKRLETDWVCLEGEILPSAWYGKRLEKYGDILLAGEARYDAAASVLKRFDAEERVGPGRECLRKYRELFESVSGRDGDSLSFAPHHLIAAENRGFFGMPNSWHIETLNGLARRAGAPFVDTPYRLISLEERTGVEECLALWRGCPGIAIKTLPFFPAGKRGAAQPAFLCRNREQLRLVYGPEYDLPENRLRLNGRKSLLKRRNKRRKILKQWELALEGVQRFLAREPRGRIQECARRVLALD